MATTSKTFNQPKKNKPEEELIAQDPASQLEAQLRQANAGVGGVVNQLRNEANAANTSQDTGETKLNPLKPEVIIDMDTGKPSGLRLPNGESLLGLSPREVKALTDNWAGKQINPETTQPAGTARAEAERQQAIQQSLGQAQTVDAPQNVEGASPDIGQALGAGAIGAVPGIIGGAVTGAIAGGTAGTIALPGIGTVSGIAAGAIGGAITAFLVATRSNLAQQQTEAFAADQQALIKGDRYIRSLITDTNRNPQNAPQNIALFYQTLNMIDAAHQKTWLDSQENLNRWLGKDGTRELAKFEVFDTTMRTYYLQQFNTALGAPNPSVSLITLEDLQGDVNE